MRRLSLLLSLLVLSSLAAVGSSIPFSGSGASGTVAPGQPFAYDLDSGTDWGIPGVNAGLATWSGPAIDQFTITFDLAPGIAIDPAKLGTDCLGGSTGGTVFCASPYTQPWDVTLTTDSITFTAQPGGDLLMNGDTFFVNIFFTGGDPIGASFSGEWDSPIPEPSALLLFGSGVLGVAGLFRRRLWL